MRALLVLLGGCWTAAQTPAIDPPPQQPAHVAEVRRSIPRASACEIAVDHLVEVERDELSKIPDFMDKIDAIREVTVASCDDTHWSPALMSCFADTVDTTALQQCQSLFTSDQTTDLMRRITEILTGLNAPP